MRVGLAADHGGFALKQALAEKLQTCGYAIVDFGAFQLDSDDDYPDFVIPLAHAVAGETNRPWRGSVRQWRRSIRRCQQDCRRAGCSHS